MTPERADKVMDKRLNSPRREAERWAPRDSIEDRAARIWFETPFADCEPECTAAWPATRRAIMRETHAGIMDSLARYGRLP